VPTYVTGAEALRAATGAVMLPDMDGFEVARRLRALSPPTADHRAGHVPIFKVDEPAPTSRLRHRTPDGPQRGFGG
jgi:CheY-like chemotaxis protein